MEGNLVKATLNGIAAVSAIAAACFWFAASRQPVGTHGPTGYGGTISPEQQAENEKIARGAKFNAFAAGLAGVSALAQGIALLIPEQ
jgi:hypothetical protein